tara:strand:+ start:36354 stop:36995 length:642 start_codon:yes stop_codon:yes gene_type:complete
LDIKSALSKSALPFILIIAGLVTSLAHANDDKQPTLLVLGDSLSAGYGFDASKGWVELLQQRITKEHLAYRVVNGSVSGNTTGDGLTRLPALIKRHQPAIIIIALGANDGLRGYSIKSMQKNLVTIIKKSRESGARTLITHMEIPPNYGRRYTEQFKNSFATIAAQENVNTLPFFLYQLVSNPQLMLDDGIHPNAKAQDLILETLWPSIRELL